MSNKQFWGLLGGEIVLAILLIVVLVGGNNQSGTFGSGTRFPYGISADTTSPLAGEVRGTTLTITGVQTLTGATTLSSTATIGGLLTLNAGQLNSYSSASSSVTTGTASQSDIMGYDTLLWTPGGAAATKTVTLPATSTLTSMIPTAGDRQETCIYNATSTAASTITLVAGTGMDIERVATSTTSGSSGLLVIPAQGSACLKFFRETDTDVSVLMTSYIDAD